LKKVISLSLFNPQRHRDARINPGVDMMLSRQLNHAQIGLSETSVAASDYPLLLMKDGESGRFRLVALFGLKPDTNSFLVNDQWQATYLPLAIVGAPFHLGGPEKSLCIDEGSDLVSTDAGAALYSGDGAETAELSRVRAMFDYLRQDLDAANDFVAALVALDLVRPLSITLEFSQGDYEAVEGLYSLSPPRLAALEDATIVNLHRRDWLNKACIMINSLNQMNRIQQLHNLHFDKKITRLISEMGSE
jgi:SapC